MALGERASHSHLRRPRMSDRSKYAAAPAPARAGRIMMMLIGCAAMVIVSGALLDGSATELAGVAATVAVIGGKTAAIPTVICVLLRATE